MRRLKSAIGDEYEIEVVECDCGFHLGVDATYLDQVGDFTLKCPACGTEIPTDLVFPEGPGPEVELSRGKDKAWVVAIDTPEMEEGDGGPKPLRIYLNEATLYADPPRPGGAVDANPNGWREVPLGEVDHEGYCRGCMSRTGEETPISVAVDTVTFPLWGDTQVAGKFDPEGPPHLQNVRVFCEYCEVIYRITEGVAEEIMSRTGNV